MVMDLLDDRLGVFQAFFLHGSGAEVIGRRVVRFVSLICLRFCGWSCSNLSRQLNFCSSYRARYSDDVSFVRLHKSKSIEKRCYERCSLNLSLGSTVIYVVLLQQINLRELIFFFLEY